MKNRLQKVLCTVFFLLCAGLFYAWFARRTGWSLPCLFFTLTGFKCPGCGVSRMCMALLHGDLREAYLQNRAVLLLLPAGVYVALAWCVGYVRSGERLLRGTAKIVAWGVAGALVLFGVARNFLGW